MKHIILATTNDLETDQRVHRIALTLLKSGATVSLVGRLLPSSSPLPPRPYATHRFHMVFQKGFLFYAFYNVRLFIYLLSHPVSIIVSNDLDTLPACRLAAWFRRKNLAYDSHEYFTEVPELVGRPMVKNFWKILERLLVPGLQHCYTVNASIASEYNRLYGVQMKVIRNYPLKKEAELQAPDPVSFPGKKILLYQGSLNLGRGLDLAIDAMQWLDDYVLLIIGTGDIEHNLKQQVKEAGLYEKVIFRGRVPLDKLHTYTRMAWLGLSLEEDLGLNYRYALPNKLFDYIQAGVPVMVSALPEMATLVRSLNIGAIIESRDPQLLAVQVRGIMQNTSVYDGWKMNVRSIAKEFIWEKEESHLIRIYNDLGLLF